MNKKGENVSCSNTVQCLGSMTCNGSNVCQCATNQYFDNATLTCKSQTIVDTACAANNTCRFDLGLTCQNNSCQCDALSQFWYTSNSSCVNLLNYGQTTCSANSQCLTTENTICLNGTCK